MISFANGRKFKERAVISLGQVHIREAYRRALEIQIPKSEINESELLKIYQDPEVLKALTIATVVPQNNNLNGDTVTGGVESEGEIFRSYHFNYTIPIQCGLKSIDGDDTDQVWYMQIAEETQLEIEQRNARIDIDAMWDGIAEIAEAMGGE